MEPMCQHCHRRKITRPRSLCWGCYYTPGVRERYPSTSKYGRWADDPENRRTVSIEEARMPIEKPDSDPVQELEVPDELIAKAFNQGGDARFAGRPLSANPYSTVWRYRMWLHWNLGWHDLDSTFGRWARWPVRPLPEVREEAA